MLEKYIKAARRQTKADLVLKNASYVDVFSGKIRKGDIAIVGEKIVGIGEYEGVKEIDCKDYTVIPGLIDGHVHIESSQLSPEEFARTVVPRGTTAVIADPHEIVNVLGMSGCEYIIKASQGVPLDIMINLPSCVPATPFETSGATLTGSDVERHIKNPDIFGLGEFMNYPALLNCDGDALKKAEAALSSCKVIDGHAPNLSGYDLNAYLCCGISTDHECSSEAEVDEKISKGMYLHIRHGSTAKNLSNARFMTDGNSRRFLLCTDDRHAADLKEYGHIDDALRNLVKDGIDPVRAVTCATLNAAECYNLKDRGGIAPFRLADLVAVDNLKDFNAKIVIKGGKVVAKDGKALFDAPRYLPANVLDTVHIRTMKADDFKMEVKGEKAKAITVSAGKLVTGCEIVDIERIDGDITVKNSDILKLAVVERHRMTGNIGKGLIKGYGFKGGALGLTVSHDSHNIILLGDDNEAMAMAANRLKEIGGGMVIAESDGNVHSLTLDIAGLMSSADADSLQRDSRKLIEKARKMGVKSGLEPFMSLAFLSLAVIPRLKLLDTGLFDVEKFEFTNLEA